VTTPTNRTQVALKYVTTLVTRGTAPDYSDVGAIRVIGQAANQNAGVDWSATRRHACTGPARSLKGYLRPQDILVNSTGTGTLGRVGYFTSGPDELPCVVDGHVTLVRADTDVVDPRYLYYQLASRAFYDYIYAALVVGATNQIELNREKLLSAPVWAPEIAEQRRIADFLDAETARIDAVDNARERVLEILDERLATVRSDHVSGRTLGGPTRFVPPIGNVHHAWEVLPLRRLTQRIGVGVVINPSTYFAQAGVPFIHGSNVRDGWFDLTDVKRISPSDSHTLWRSMLAAGDVVVVRAGYPGRAAVATTELEGANCASVLIIRCDWSLQPEFLEAFFNSNLGRAQVDLVRYGAAQEQINVGHVVKFVVPCPPLPQQRAQVDSLTRALTAGRELIQTVTRQRSLLAERRQALIMAAVTGQFDVTTARGADLS
jgi:type I restriction enzyme S subunit